MFQRLSDSVNRRLAPLIPERKLILRSEDGSRYHHVSPLMQASAAALIIGLVGWTGFSSLKLVETSLRASSASERLAISEAAFQERIARLEAEAKAAKEALAAAELAANQSIAQLSDQHRKLTSAVVNERELAAKLQSEQGRFYSLANEHDSALKLCETTEERLSVLKTALAEKTQEAESRGAMLSALNTKLGDVASARDNAAETTHSLTLQVDELSAEISQRAAQQDLILTRLEDAAKSSLGSLEDVFRDTGIKIEPIIDAVRKEKRDGSGGPFIPEREMQALGGDQNAPRLAALMSRLERVNLLRIAAERMPFGRPVKNARMTSGFGRRHDPINKRRARHTGIDYAARRGTPILATAAGKVTFVGWRHGYGKVVEICHDFGYETLYAHLNKTRVKTGARVERGDRIGDMGNTGRSTGTHVHYEVRIGGTPVNPAKYIEAARHVL